MTERPTPSGEFRRQQAARARGVPTITALVGPAAPAVRAWGEWARAEGRPCATAAAEPGEFLPAWVGAAFAAAPPAERACAWLAAATGQANEVVARDTERMTLHDLGELRRSLPGDPQAPGAAAAFLVLADRASGRPHDPTRFARELGETGGVARVVRAVAELYPPPLWPALLLVAPAQARGEWCLSAARALERVLAAEPGVPVAIALPPELYADALAGRPASRAAALLREGFVEVRSVSANELEVRLRAAGVEPPPGTVRRLAAAGISEAGAEEFVAAARRVARPTPAEVASDFRSLHEEFLFGQLESMPQTAGLFRPNHPLGFRHGNREAEGDLVAESLKLAVEVDGGHFHLSAEQYRRDRRKDWLYQSRGYLVLRFLADDVVADFEAVLGTILEAVALRRASRQPHGAA